MISALIIDNEAGHRDALRRLLEAHCPGLTVAGEAANAEDALREIRQHRPQLLFLEIRLPDVNGFGLLKMLPGIDPEVIFVSASERYAFKAFEFNAAGYILKPIDRHKLVKAVEKAMERVALRDNIILHLVKSVSGQNELMNKITVHHNGKVVFIDVAEICFIESKEEHTTLTLFDNSQYYSSKDLSQFEHILEEANGFIRINKSVLINTRCVKSYSKGGICVIEMKGGQSFEASRRRKSDVLSFLKDAKSF